MSQQSNLKNFKATKTEKQDAIAYHFSKTGKRMTNLTKVKLNQLDEIILNHNIEVEAYVMKKRTDEANKKTARLEEEAKRNVEWNIKITEQRRMLVIWNELSETEKELVYKKRAIIYELIERERDWVKIEKENKATIAWVDRECEHTKLEGYRVERTGENTMTINGVNVIHNYIHKKKTATEHLDYVKRFDDKSDTYNCPSLKHLVELIAEENKEEFWIIPVKKVKTAKKEKRSKKLI